MSIELTEQQSKAIELVGNTPASVIDPRTKKSYVLVSAEVFERVRTIIPGEDYALADTYGAQFAAAMNAGWGDPGMDDYNNYDAHRPT